MWPWIFKKKIFTSNDLLSCSPSSRVQQKVESPKKWRSIATIEQDTSLNIFKQKLTINKDLEIEGYYFILRGEFFMEHFRGRFDVVEIILTSKWS